MLNLNEPIKVAYLQKLANKSILSGVHVIEMTISSFSESAERFYLLRNRGTF